MAKSRRLTKGSVRKSRETKPKSKVTKSRGKSSTIKKRSTETENLLERLKILLEKDKEEQQKKISSFTEETFMKFIQNEKSEMLKKDDLVQNANDSYYVKNKNKVLDLLLKIGNENHDILDSLKTIYETNKDSPVIRGVGEYLDLNMDMENLK